MNKKATHDQGHSDLVSAVKKGERDRVLYLISGMTRDELQNVVGPVFCLAKTIAVAELLLEHGVNVNSASSDGTTWLHMACALNRVSEIQLAMRHGADPNARDENGDTPLFVAELDDCVEAIQAIVSAGADVNAQNNDGDTPLHLAAANGRIRAVEALLRCGASTQIRDRKGATALIIVPGLRDECRIHGARIAELLIAYGADIHACDDNGWQAIHYAAHLGCGDLLMKLIQLGSNPDVRTSNGYTAWDLADQPSTLKILEKHRDVWRQLFFRSDDN